MHRTLASIPIGGSAVVAAVTLPSALKERLMDLGLTPGCRVRVLYQAASGDPRAYAVRGAVLAIRRRDADGIEVTAWD